MRFQIEKCIVTHVDRNEKTNRDSMTVVEGRNVYYIAGGELDLTKVPIEQIVALEGEIVLADYQGKKYLRLLSLNVKKPSQVAS